MAGDRCPKCEDESRGDIRRGGRMKPTATEKYNDRIEEARKLLVNITKGLAEHVAEAGTEVNWAHVGDLGCLIDTLTEADDFIHGRG